MSEDGIQLQENEDPLSSDLKACELYDVVNKEPNGSLAMTTRERKEERHSEFLRKQYIKRFGPILEIQDLHVMFEYLLR